MYIQTLVSPPLFKNIVKSIRRFYKHFCTYFLFNLTTFITIWYVTILKRAVEIILIIIIINNHNNHNHNHNHNYSNGNISLE